MAERDSDEAIGRALRQQCAKMYGVPLEAVRLVRSPLRICPLGAHVDHQLGLVTGFALDRSVWVAFVPREDGWIQAHSWDYAGEVRFRWEEVPPPQPGDWGNYLRGAVYALKRKRTFHRGISLLVRGSLPTGGLGSSAAVGVAYLLAMEAVNDWKIAREENIRLDQIIENEYLGLRNGILDQSMTLLGQRGKLLLLDCRDGTYQALAGPPPEEYRLLIVHSGYSEALVSTDYNRRVSECESAAKELLQRAGQPLPEHPVLRDVREEWFERYASALSPPLAKRARHFFTEQRRVREGVEAWQMGDLERFGRLITESGRSSIENYECGRPELITLYEILISTPGVLGARFSGAGFRGSCLALVEREKAEGVREAVLERYRAAVPEVRDRCAAWWCASAEGAEVR